MNQATHVILREILARWLADPAGLEDAVLWCERYLAQKPYSLIDDSNQDIAWSLAGSWRLEHRHQLNRWTRALMP